MIDAHGRHTSSTGAVLAASAWLDAHFEVGTLEWESLVAAVDIPPGSRILDVGCGSGSFLPALARATGDRGELTALDTAPEHLALVERRAREWQLPCPISTKLGNISSLPFADRSFDVVWCASVTQYLSDGQLVAALRELSRVIRPGGLLAIKDVDMLLMRIYPADRLLLPKLSAAAQAADRTPQSAGSLRGRELRRWLERAGLEHVRQRTTLVEHWAPLAPSIAAFYKTWLAYLAQRAHEVGMGADDLAQWRPFLDAASSVHPVDRPDFYVCEGQVLAVGTVGSS